MEKDVVISIRGMQWYENRESDSIGLVPRGVMLRDGVVCTLSYQESKLTGMEGTLTTIQVEGEQVSMLRVGEYNTQMVFQTGRRHLSVYNTPYGAMEVGVNTRHLLAELKEDSGIIEVDYDIEVDHALAGRNAVQIEIAPVEGASLKRQERDSV